MDKLKERLLNYSMIVAIHLSVVVAWHVFVVWGDVPAYVMPTPADTILSLGEEYNWIHNTLITSGEVFGGYGLAVIVGVGLAMLFSWFDSLETVLMPLVVSLNMIP